MASGAVLIQSSSQASLPGLSAWVEVGGEENETQFFELSRLDERFLGS